MKPVNELAASKDLDLHYEKGWDYDDGPDLMRLFQRIRLPGDHSDDGFKGFITF